ncbi:MAG: DNA alkylation repair protein [Alphaproteobacteria bacterium]|nr:DNA alkylation repair protein [Alphaproteobacteria bacterium]
MSSLEGLRTKPLHNLEGLRIKPVRPRKESASFLDRVSQFGKGALSGFSRAAMSEAADQASSGVMEVGGMAVPISESTALANIPQKGIESLDAMKPRENDSLGNILYKAGEFGGATASLPLPTSTGVNAARSAIGGGGKSLLTKFAKDIGTGSSIGAGSGVMQEAGVDPLYADLISSLATPTAIVKSKSLLNNFTKPRETLAKIPMKLMGLTPKSMNIEAARAARDLGIDLPAAAVTDSKLTALADQYVGKAPIFGNKLKNKYLLAEEQTQKVLSDIFDEIGPSRTPEIEGQIAGRYNKVETSLPADAKVLPINLKKAIDDIKINTAILSPDEKSLLQSLETIKNEIEPASKIISQYGPIKLPLQEYDVNKLVGTKKSLNSIIKWDTGAGVKNHLKRIQKAISQDIKEYGKTNPEWYDAFKEADKLYGDVAKRERLENILRHKATSDATESLSYNTLAKAINNHKNTASIRKQLTPETFEKIQKLGTVAKAMAIKSKNIPNPSGTATTGGISAAIFGLFYDPITTAKLLGAGYGASRLLTDKKFLDLALKLAENPNNLATTTALNHRIKEITGYSAVALSKNLQHMNNAAE